MSQALVKHPGGRPTKINEDTVRKLEAVFRLGVTDEVACRYAKISRDTFYRHLREDPEFSDRIQSAKEFTRIMAAQTVVRAFVEDKDVKAAQWWLEHKYPEEFGTPPQILQQINIGAELKKIGEDLGFK
jgi:hypothetical protein